MPVRVPEPLAQLRMEDEVQKELSHSPVDDDDRKALALSSCSSSSSSLEPNKSIAERRAAKLGFNAQCIKTTLFQTRSPAGSPTACSPRLFIPPGISPTTLLDSPIMLPNSQALPSPTTGTFRVPSFSRESSIVYSLADGDGDRRSDLDYFNFMPYEDSNSLSTFSTLVDKGADLDYEDDVSVQPSMHFEFPAELSKADTTENCALDLSTELKVLKNMGMNGNIDLHIHHSDAAGDQKSLPKESIDGEDVGTSNLLEEDLKGLYPSTGTMRASEDGYNWRKYGQKQVKGSEYPRSYYKCTHLNCHVKKKVERSQDGQITEIIYKGTHNHAKPQPNRRASLGSSFSMEDMSEMMDEVSGSFVKVEGGSVWRNVQPGMKDMIKLGSNWRSDGVEGASSVSVVSDLSDPLSIAPGKSMGVLESFESPELSSTFACHDDDDEEEDEATQGSISRGDNADEDESESKRRKKESCLIETNLATRAVREPRVVVQIESEVDILEDGYRWRKYGQKVVKGNPNPRSYYKCTSAGCCVRKHVERASNNIKCVITTYEGKHNHEVPAARNSIPLNSGTGNVPSTVANAQPALTAARNTNSPKSETQVQELGPHFDRKLEFNNDYLRPSFLGNIGNDMKFGASSIYQMKFPPLQNTVPYATLRLNSNCNVNPHSYSPVVPDFPMPLPLNLPQAAFNFNVGKPAAPVQPFLSGQQLKEHDARLLKPKQELKDNSLYEACLPVVDHANASSSSSSPLYPQVRRCFPP